MFAEYEIRLKNSPDSEFFNRLFVSERKQIAFMANANLIFALPLRDKSLRNEVSMSNFFGFQGGNIPNDRKQKGSFFSKLNDLKNNVTESISNISETVVEPATGTYSKPDSSFNNNIFVQPLSQMSDVDILRTGAECLNNNNTQRAFELLKEGARRGNMECAMMLHDYMEKNNTDAEERFFWARFAADANVAMGEYYTASYYKDGNGVFRNVEKAFIFAEAAIRHTKESEKTVIEELYKNIEAEFVAPNENMEAVSLEMIEKQIEAAKESGKETDYISSVIRIKRMLHKNIGVLYYWLGNFYETGMGVRMDLNEALRLYGLAIKYGYANDEINYRCDELRKRMNMTITELNNCAKKAYSVGNNDPYIVFSYIQYVYFNRLGAEKNNYNACFEYALKLNEQLGTKRDYSEAVFYYKKCIALISDNSNEDMKNIKGLAYKRLSFMYFWGKGVTGNQEQANYYFNEAKRYMRKPDAEFSVAEFINKYKNPVTEINDDRAEILWKGAVGIPDVDEAIKIYARRKTVVGVRTMAWIYAAGYYQGLKPDYEAAMEEFKIYKNNVKPTALYYAWQAGNLLAIYNYQFMDTAVVFQVHHASYLMQYAIKNNMNLLANEICDYLSRVGYSDPQALYQNLKAKVAEEENKKKENKQPEVEKGVEKGVEKEVKKEVVKEAGKNVQAEDIVTQMAKDTEQKMINPDTQNAQMKPEIKAKDEVHEWPEVDRILQLEKEENWEELISLGCEFCDKVSQDEEETSSDNNDTFMFEGEEYCAFPDDDFDDNYEQNADDYEGENKHVLNMDAIYAALCFKTAAIHGSTNAMYNLVMCFSGCIGVPINPFLVKKIVERLDAAGVNFEDTGIYEWIDQTLEEMEDREGFNWEDYGQEYLNIAEELEENHHSCMEWILYEYYRMSSYHMTHNGIVTSKFRDKFYNQRVDWDQLLALPWETMIKSEQDKERNEIHVESLDTQDGENDKSENGEIINLDSYFEGMIGMEPVKAQLEKIYQSVKMQIRREEILRERGDSIPENEKGYNFILLGNPGTGKTTVARIIAKILYDIKVRKSDSFIEIDRSKVVSDHVGGTEKSMREILQKIEGGTLFIDEAYTLYEEDSDNDFGQKAINILMKDMEDNRNSYSVIMAGYKIPMENMIRNANSGFSSRFAYKIELPDYSDEALIEMAHAQIKKQQFKYEDDVDQAIVRCIAHDRIDETFGNARYIRELINRAVENQAQRLSNQENYDNDELFVLKACDFWQGHMKEKGVKEYLEELNSLCGLNSVKSEVNSIINMLNVQKEMEKRGLPVNDQLGTLHMAFKGNPGTGKTTVARLLGKLYAACGVLKRGDVFVECNRADLVASYMGQTADKVKKAVQSALGGILFIDEAYSLVQSDNDSFGQEALTQLLAQMENNRDNLIVIFAGYSDELDELFNRNPGLRSRIPKDLIFEDYSIEELNQIALNLIKSQKMILTPKAEDELKELLSCKVKEENFSNARGVRNIVDKMKRNQATRISNCLMNGEAVSDEMLVTINEEDIRQVY